ncbi:MAG: hypothetical protein ABI841_02870 [Chloroflexota bacterium]
MPRVCTVCSSPDRDAIDAALVSGAPMRRIAPRYGVSETAIRRHRNRHLSPAIVALQEQREEERGETLADRLEGLYRRAERILDAAETGRQGQLSLAAIRELRGIAELLGKLTGELRDQPTVTVNLMASPEWLAVRAALLEALATFPAARSAVAARLAALSAPSGIEPRPPLLLTGAAGYNATDELS